LSRNARARAQEFSFEAYRERLIAVVSELQAAAP
jgi:hypothetical protein